ALGMADGNALAVVQRAIKCRRLPQKIRLLALQMAHLLDDVDALRRVERFIEDARAFEPEIHEGEVDVVISARSRLERIARPLLTFQARAHGRQIFPRT